MFAQARFLNWANVGGFRQPASLRADQLFQDRLVANGKSRSLEDSNLTLAEVRQTRVTVSREVPMICAISS